MVGLTRRALALGLLATGVLARGGSGQAPEPRVSGASVEAHSASIGDVELRSELATADLSRGASKVRVSAVLGRVRLAQEGTVHDIAVASATTDSLIVSRLGVASAGVNGWSDDGARPRLGGYATAEFRASHEVALDIHVAHDPIWRPARGVDPLRALRVRDLRQLDRGLTASEVRLAASFGAANDPRVRVEVGGTRYSHRSWRALFAAQTAWEVNHEGDVLLWVEPNAYAESFRQPISGFLSPLGHVRLGTSLRAESERGPVSVEAVLDPHLFRDERGTGVGVGGTVRATLSLGVAAIEISGHFMRQGSYRFIQAGFRVAAR